MNRDYIYAREASHFYLNADGGIKSVKGESLLAGIYYIIHVEDDPGLIEVGLHGGNEMHSIRWKDIDSPRITMLKTVPHSGELVTYTKIK
jgi:hypothetical protein